MAYQKQTWQNGERVVASKLNHMEDGIAEMSQGGSGGNEYDAVVYLYHIPNSGVPYEITIEKGNFSTLMSLLNSAIPPRILVKCWDRLSHWYFTTSLVAIYSWNGSAIDFRVKAPTYDTGSSALNDVVHGLGLVWSSDDTITVF